MDFKSWLQAAAAHAGVFACGALCWAMAARGNIATAIVAAVAALILANLLMLGLRRRASPVSRAPEATFASEQSHRRLSALVDETPSPLLLQEEDGRLIAVNRAARQMFDTAAELPLEAHAALLATGERLDSLGGQIDWAGKRFAVHKARLNHALLAILIDITPEVRAAEAAALRDLLKVLNHELMNALTPVASMSRSALDLIGDDTADSRAAAKKALATVVARTEGLVGFVESYRVLTRLPPPDIQPVTLAPFVAEIAEAFRAQWRERVAFETNGEPGGVWEGVVVLMDREQVRLALTNLLNNAAEAAVVRPEPRVRLAVLPGDGVVDLSVEDSGGGIDPELAETVFLPFYTTKASGTGVGLSLARQILQGHGSTLSLKPPQRLGGACFGFSLAQAALPKFYPPIPASG